MQGYFPLNPHRDNRRFQNPPRLHLADRIWLFPVIREDIIPPSNEVLVEQNGESKNQIFRLIRLTELIVGLLDMVDARKIGFTPAVEVQ